MNNKHTAVEWLVKELEEHHVFHDIKNTNAYHTAIQMEKQQIVQAFKEGLRSPYHQDYTIVTQEGQEETKSGQYYNEKYASEK